MKGGTGRLSCGGRSPVPGARAVLIAFVASTFVSCVPDEASESRTATRDSAGIRIVENVGSTDAVSPWSIPAEPIFRVGWGEEDPEFERLASGYIGRDGRAWVVDQGAQLVYAFSPEGELIRSFGGMGEGPGEFVRPSVIFGLGGDSLLVSDVSTRRATVFAGGEHLYDERIEYGAEAIYEPSGRVGDGAFVLMPTGFALYRDPEPGWKAYPIVRSADFVTVDTIATLPLMWFRASGDLNPIYYFGTVTFASGRIIHATSDRPEIRWMDADGEVVQIARWDQAPEVATDEHWAAYESDARERASDPGDPQFQERLQQRRRDFGGTLPFFESLHADRTGGVWLGEYDIRPGFPSSDAYHVVSSEGVWLGRVRFPREIRILDITDTRVLGVEQDEFDVQAVVLYAIEKRDG